MGVAMQIEWLEGFIKVASTQSITAAARELNVTQPCLSNHIRNLEREMGGPLFERGISHTTLTPLGKVLLSEIQLPMAGLREALRVTRSASRTPTSRVIVEAYVPYKPVDDIIYDAEASFIRDRKLVEVDVKNIRDASPLDDVRQGVADLVFMQLSSAADLAGLASREVFREPMVCIVPVHHPLASREKIMLDDLQGEAICRYEHPAAECHADLILESLAAHGVHVTERRFPWDRNARDSRNYFFYDCVLLESKSHIGHDIPRGALEGYRVVDFDESFVLPTSLVFRAEEAGEHVLGFIERVMASVESSALG